MPTSEYIGQYIRPDGYNGNKRLAHLCLANKKLIEVYPDCFCPSPFLEMDIADTHEALWLINNHPRGKYYTSPHTNPMRCPDCGEYGHSVGHMERQYPQDHE